ncbi:nuclear transport factor 2 family protein [Mucilaginibacter roseus]|uniref:Nuclear transport factor 2 family protein n=1 Tax=Mucilaginibacter roseus TaxID=1528868 RepID=A0ABS8TWN1_9SPHI|nr:nuclear transport factor 2 family protein [Mucilaginibacter roseus]MCD8739285.1 nuclear transport factor 2 family protein [Mucilaginibacter roseus]
MNSDNKATLIQANNHVTTGDNEGFLAYCTDDVVWEFVGDQVLKGKEAVRAYMKEAYVEPPKFDVQNLIAGDNFVTAIGFISMKNEQGEIVNYSYCDVWEFRDGKMAALKAFVIAV